MKTAKKAMTGGEIVKTIAEKTGLKSKDVKGVFGELQTIAYAGGEDGEVRDPAACDAEAEAQEGHEGWGEDDVRQGGEGGGEAREEGCEGLPRQGPQ